MYFDTMGRMISTLNPDFMQGGNLPDYTYRGDFATRRVMGSYSAIGPTLTPATAVQPTFGHIVEEYNYLLYRYDNLSLFPLLPNFGGGGREYAGESTASTSVDGQVSFAIPLTLSLIPFGSCIVEITSVAGDATRNGLYRAYSGGGVGTFLYIRHLDGTVPTAAEFPLGSVPEAIAVRLYYSNSIGKLFADPYLNAGNSSVTQTPTQIVGVGAEADAVGMVFAGPDRTELYPITPGDRHAYRVTAETLGGPAAPSNKEVAALDLGGYHKANDYLYNLPLPAVTKQLNMATFTGLDAFGASQWAFDTSLASTWFALNHAGSLRIPLDLPRSSARLDSGGTRTHQTTLQYITIMGRFFAGVALANVTVHKVRCTPGSPPTRLDTLLFVVQPPVVYPCTTSTDLAASGVGGATYYVSVFEDNTGTLPVYIDDTEDYFYYLVIQSNNGGASLDEVYGVQVTYKDPGPRNY